MSSEGAQVPFDSDADVSSSFGRLSLYAHVPFCSSKCAYCDFYSAPAPAGERAALVDALIAEADSLAELGVVRDVGTVYVGGGTPTVLGQECVRLVAGLVAHAPRAAEVTVEANPESVSAALVSALVQTGATRFSLGVQSLDGSVLARLGRCHSVEQALEAARLLETAGTPFSVDLMCGVPGQTRDSWIDSLVGAIGTGAGHVSVYPLSVEPGTPIAADIATGLLPESDPDIAADQMMLAQELLQAAGLLRYEVANYARKGEESVHNTGYWTGRPYLGLGPSASSMLAVQDYSRLAEALGWPPAPGDAARVRFTRGRDTSAYSSAPLAQPAEIEWLTAAEALREDVMLGMRLARGVEPREVVRAGLEGVFRSLEADGLVILLEWREDEPRWCATERGWLLGNEVFGRIWAGE